MQTHHSYGEQVKTMGALGKFLVQYTKASLLLFSLAISKVSVFSPVAIDLCMHILLVEAYVPIFIASA